VHHYLSEVIFASLEYEETTCKQMLVKDIYAATENLSPLNVIGQGIAGTCQDYDLYIVKKAKYIFYTKT
jgi:hypothetical protein